MRRLFFFSLTLAWLGGCSCQEKTSATAPNDAGAAQSPQQAPTPVQEVYHPPSEPTIPERALELHTQGRTHMEAGKHDEALKSFEQAQALAPSWRLPLYDTAYTHVLMGDNAQALKLYEQLDEMEPLGFAQSKKLLDSLRREQDGRVPKGTLREFLAVQQLRDLAEARSKLEAMTKTAPNFVLAWRELAMSSEDIAESERLLEKALALIPDVETRGELLVHKGVLLRRRGQEEEALKHLKALSVDKSLLHSQRSQAREVLNSPAPER
jgi:tetratricopeptide (TPR) repeat protein